MHPWGSPSLPIVNHSRPTMPGMNESVFGALATEIGIAYAENGTSGDAIETPPETRSAASGGIEFDTADNEFEAAPLGGGLCFASCSQLIT